MNKRKNRNKITKYRRYSFFNIGTLLFSLVFLYMIIMMVMYLTQTHVTSYEVTKGTLTGNYRYEALALREETIVTATQSGTVRYFEREGAKASAGSTVCAIDETGSTVLQSISDFSMTEDDEERLQNILSSFTINFSTDNFQRTYDLKASVEGLISEVIEENSDSSYSTRNACYAPASGFVLYKIDGFEDTEESEITSSMFSQSSYSAVNLRSQGTVSAGDDLFKLVTSEEWTLYFPLDATLTTELADSTTIKFRFLKDNVTFSSSFEIITNGEESFGKITLDNSLVRYVTDRFLEIELVLNKKSGLKVPISAISTRTFYRIPEEYAIVNESTDDEITLLVESFAEDGSSTTKYLTATVYSYSDGYYLVDSELLSEDDYIRIAGTTMRKRLSEDDIETLYGVYNINKGYAVFREITIIDQNEEYCIVESNNTYGLAAYDYIALDASQVTDDQIVY
ncbi:MAG: hypothetical protein LUG56_06365 [Lachnospiraceae bacterium]|nr:hypothetical protein [Lachnospiraceae bacterium]MCD7842079.1 hypothetical protein [Lachnospiraceae bacterium]